MSADASTFYFHAGTPDGSVFSGQLSAFSAEEALTQLKQRGFQPLRLDSKPIRQSWLDQEVSFGGGRRLNLVECEAFCRELALLLCSGVTVSDAVAIMLPSLKPKSRLKGFVEAIRQGLRLGRSLSEAAGTSGVALPNDLVPVLRAGEASGSLPVALAMLAGSYAEANRFARTYTSALAYPALLLCVSMLVLGLIAFFVAPSLTELFTSMERPVPIALAALSGTATFVSSNLATLGVAVALVFVLLGAGSAAGSVRRLAHRVLFGLPVIGTALRWSASRRFAATLRLYLASNVPMAMALPNALTSAGFPAGPERELIERVRAGGRLADSLTAARLLPAKLTHLIAVGESSGRLVEVLDAVVSEAKARFEQRMALTTALLAPALILVVGSLIGLVIFSVFSALLDVNELTF